MREGMVRCTICGSIVRRGDRCPACDEPLPAEQSEPAVQHVELSENVLQAEERQCVAVHELADTQLGTGPLSVQESVRLELAHLNEHIQIGEYVLHLAEAHFAGHKGLLALTDHRLLFVCVEPAGYRVETFRFERIEGVVAGRKGTHGTLNMHSFGTSVQITAIQPGDRTETIAAYVRDRVDSILKQLGSTPRSEHHQSSDEPTGLKRPSRTMTTNGHAGH